MANHVKYQWEESITVCKKKNFWKLYDKFVTLPFKIFKGRLGVKKKLSLADSHLITIWDWCAILTRDITAILAPGSSRMVREGKGRCLNLGCDALPLFCGKALYV